MEQQTRQSIQQFLVIGISHQTCPVNIREKFHLTEESQKQMLREGHTHGVSTIIPVSTCNRTEIYAHTRNSELITYLFRKHSRASMEEFISHCYIYKGHGAIKHLFKVACGLDSQIVGELEISGQLKGAFQKAYESGMVNTFTERLIQYVNQSSKEIKTKTALSSGAASVSRAAVQYLRNRVENLQANRVLMLGAGEIGRNTCDNLLKYVSSKQVTVINRTLQRAKTFAATYQCQYDHYENRHRYIKESDVIIVATGANHSTITPEDFESTGDRKHTIILDLSVPRNVSSSLTLYHSIDLVTTDKLQEQNEEVLKTREESVPKAMEIIEYHMELFFNWLNTNSLSPVFSGFQYYLNSIKQKEMEKYKNKITKNQMDHAEEIADRIINKITGQCISYLKNNNASRHTPAEVISYMFRLHQK